jgi:serine/threonine protein phosphatase PrpC
MKNYILYHENNRKKPYILQEDAYESADNIYVVADGITHDVNEEGLLPIPSDSAKVAQIICDEIVNLLIDKNPSIDSIKNAYYEANKKVSEFNVKSRLYADRENNGYSIGAATSAAIIINGNKLLYGVLDDCLISVFSDDYTDHPILTSYVDRSAKYLDSNFDWSKSETRKLWRKEIRNNIYTHEGKEYGYGAIDGREGFVKYLQLGEVELKPHDLICVYTDGFIKMIQNIEFVKGLREQTLSANTYEYINKWADKLDAHKEKTAYFIKH